MSATFLSILLLFAVLSFIQINRIYTKGFTVKQTQDTGRILLEDIVRTIRSSRQPLTIYDEPGEAPGANPNFLRMCTEGTTTTSAIRYAWNEYNGAASNFTNERVTYTVPDGKGGILYSYPSDFRTLKTEAIGAICDDPVDFTYEGVTTTSTSREFLLHDLDITPIEPDTAGNDSLQTTYHVTLVLSTKQQDLLETKGDDARCKVGRGDEYCHVVRLEAFASIRN